MVNQNSIFKKIGYILNELQDQYEYLSANPEQLSELELELFLANANFLTDHVQIVKKLHENVVVKELPSAGEAHHDLDAIQPAIQEVVQEESKPVFSVNEEIQTPTFEFVINDHIEQPAEAPELEEIVHDNEAEERVDYFEEQEIEEVTEEPVQEPVEETGPEPFLVTTEDVEQPLPKIQQQPEPFFKPEPVAEAKPVVEVAVEPETVVLHSTPPVAPEPAPEPVKLTLNDLLASKKSGTTPPEETKTPAITDLKRAVNLNEKLLYIKDLFNGYNLAYSEAIEIINKLPDFQSADNFLKKNYAEKNNWDAKQTTVNKFYDLLRQRFPD